jgi:hypothetical protein
MIRLKHLLVATVGLLTLITAVSRLKALDAAV